MTKIERRRAVVTLHHGNYEAELADLMEQYEVAARAELTGGSRRAGTKSKAAALAVEHDEKRAEADETATKVTVWAIGWDEWSQLTEMHSPREGDAGDAKAGFDRTTFPSALLRASLIEPSDDRAVSVQDKVALGLVLLHELDLSRLHYAKLETAAWNVNAGDDSLGKVSLVSLHKQVRELDSKPQPDSE